MLNVAATTTVTDTIYRDRFSHLAELKRLGADINLIDNTAIIRGGTKLSGANVMCSDLRAGACLMIAGLISNGTTVVNRIYHLDRGYEQMDKKLNKLGAVVERIIT